MLSNLSSGGEEDGVIRSSGVRRLTKRKTEAGAPKLVRLGAKKSEGQSSQKPPARSERSSDAGSEEWSEIGSEELNQAVAAEPVLAKSSAYKCGPVDRDEVMARLRAQPKVGRDRVADWVIEERIEQDIVPSLEVSPNFFFNFFFLLKKFFSGTSEI